MRTLDDCYQKGLKKIAADLASARRSLTTAEGHLDDAEASFEIKRYRLCLTSSYEAMFHAAKALLFKDGVKEHSHVCVPVYIRRHTRSWNRMQISWTHTGFTGKKPPMVSILKSARKRPGQR